MKPEAITWAGWLSQCWTDHDGQWLVNFLALGVARMPYVKAARPGGTAHLVIVTRRVLPSVPSPVIVQGTISLAFAIQAEAVLALLGGGGHVGRLASATLCRRWLCLCEFCLRPRL